MIWVLPVLFVLCKRWLVRKFRGWVSGWKRIVGTGVVLGKEVVELLWRKLSFYTARTAQARRRSRDAGSFRW